MKPAVEDVGKMPNMGSVDPVRWESSHTDKKNYPGERPYMCKGGLLFQRRSVAVPINPRENGDTDKNNPSRTSYSNQDCY